MNVNEFRRGTTVAAIVLSLIAAVGIPIGVAAEHGVPFSLTIVAVILVAVWGSRLGVNAVYRHVFAKGQLDERGSDSDFV